jgi:hypothetical protein
MQAVSCLATKQRKTYTHATRILDSWLGRHTHRLLYEEAVRCIWKQATRLHQMKKEYSSGRSDFRYEQLFYSSVWGGPISGFEFWSWNGPGPAKAVDEHTYTRPVFWLVSIQAGTYKTKPGKRPSGRGYHIKTSNFRNIHFEQIGKVRRSMVVHLFVRHKNTNSGS